MNRDRLFQFLHFVCSYNNTRENSTEHHFIVDTYNRITPLPVGYKVKYSDSWCAVFVSFCFRVFFPDVVFPYECSCERMVAKIKDMYQQKLHINGKKSMCGYKPKSGDVVFYRFHVGQIDHIGIIINATPVGMLVIEGNYSDSVKIREVKYDNPNIYGYFEPF